MTPHFLPIPGVSVIELITNESSLATPKGKSGKILKGSVIAIGGDGITKFGAAVKQPCKIGDTVLFLSYEEVGGYDSYSFQGKKYYFVEHLDVRAVVKESK